MATRQVWDYQPEEGETPAPWAAFQEFRDGPKPRSLTNLATRIGKAYDTVATWSKEFCWFDRAAAYDTHLDQETQAVVLSDVQAMAREHLKTASLARLVAHEALAMHLTDLRKSQGAVTAQAAARLLKEAAHLERLTLGEVTERVAAPDPGLGKLTEEELWRLKELQRKARGEE